MVPLLFAALFNCAQPVAQLPRPHQRLIISKIKDIDTALLLARAILQNNWSRDALEANIKSKYHERIGMADHNFTAMLLRPQSDLAIGSIKTLITLTF